MTSEEKLLLNRFKDLDRMALNKNKAFFTNFLDAYEYSLFLDHVNDFNSHTGIYDLIDDLERQMVFFHPDAFCDSVDFPITILKIMPKSAKFKGEISHRDILGTLMGLQIERKYIGDIRILENGEIIVLCVDSVADLIIESVDRIRHTDVMISRVENHKAIPGYLYLPFDQEAVREQEDPSCCRESDHHFWKLCIRDISD